MLGRAVHKGCSQAECLRSVQVTGVSRNHHHFAKFQAQYLRRTLIDLMRRLVGAYDIGRDDGVPRQTGVLRHVNEQPEVAVRERRDYELRLQPTKSFRRIRPTV